MKYKKYDSKTKLAVILEHLEQQVPVATLCNKYQISHTLFYYWLREFLGRAHRVFETEKNSIKERRLRDENTKLKHIIADLTIELKKTEYELNGGRGL
jgi:transposase-like protein